MSNIRAGMTLASVLILVVYLHVASSKSNTNRFKIPGLVEGETIAISRYELTQLYDTLLLKYDRRVRPVVNQQNVVSVNSKFVPICITDFDTANQKFSIAFYMKVAWTDQLLTWIPDKYGGTNYIKVPVKDIWLPKLTITEVR